MIRWTLRIGCFCRQSPTIAALITLVMLLGIALPARAQGELIPGNNPAPAQDESAEADDQPVLAPGALQSPAATLETFVTAMFNADLERAASCLDLDGVVPEKRDSIATKLYRILNRIERIDFNHIAIVDGRADQIGTRTTWTYFPRPDALRLPTFSPFAPINQFSIVEAKAPNASIVLGIGKDGRWRFTSDTVAGIDDFWDRVADLPVIQGIASSPERVTIAERLQKLFPASMNTGKVIGVKYWQWVCILATIFIGIILDFTVRGILRVVSRRVIARRGGEAKKETLRRTVRPFGLTAAALLWLWAIGVLDLPNEALMVLVPAVKLLAMMTTVWSAYRVTDLLGEVAASKAERTATRFDDLLIPLIRKTLKVFITAFGLVYIAGALNIPIAPLVAGLGIGGAGFAFAAKDTLEHLFGSVTVIADRPFEVGDWVVINDVEGTVESLGFRSTRVRTFYNSLITVPNGNLVRAVVDNYGRRKYRRWTTHLNVTYDTSPDVIEAFCEGIREIIRFHPYTRKDYYQVWLHKFGAHSLDILLYVFFECPDWNTELRERHRLSSDILRLADRLGVEFAFPTQTLHLRQDDPTAAHEPSDIPEGDADRRARAIGKRATRALIGNAEYLKEKPGPYEFEFAREIDEAESDSETQIESTAGGSA